MLHKIEADDDYTRFILCFPREQCSERILLERINNLKMLGVSGFVEYGRNLFGYRVLGKGYSSITVLGYHNEYGKVVVKVRRLDSRRRSLEYEGMIMDYLSPTLIPPLIYGYSRDFIVMEYIDCPSIIDVLRRNNDSLRKMLFRILASLYLVDMLAIDHGELNRPSSHMYICPNGQVRIIDWESARLSFKPHNLTMFMSYLFFRSRLINIDGMLRKKLLYILRLYKNYPAKGFMGLLGFLRSHEVVVG